MNDETKRKVGVRAVINDEQPWQERHDECMTVHELSAAVGVASLASENWS